MKSSKVTIAIFTDYSKTFDTIYFSILLKKMYTLNFSKHFLYWIFNYLTDRRHFVQIDSSISNILIKSFDVPQGSIPGPILFNLCVANMKKKLSESQCIQYADDSTIYKNLQNSVMLVHQNENIKPKPAYLEEASKIFNDISNEIR